MCRPLFTRVWGVWDTVSVSSDILFPITSHHRFVPGWDITLIKKLSQCSKMAAGPPTSVLITQYLNEYKPTWDEKQFKTAFNDRPHRLAAKFFDIAPRHITNATDLDEYYPMKVRYSPVKTPLHGTHTLAQTAPPQPTAFLSGHFIFSYGSFVTDVPYDPNIPFDGEEDSMAIRAFTSGYDMFTIIDRVFMLHFYNRKDFKTAWGEFGREWDKVRRAGRRGGAERREQGGEEGRRSASRAVKEGWRERRARRRGGWLERPARAAG